jgi:hypothetical protein
MNDAEFQAHITALRRYGPTWANLRVLGNTPGGREMEGQCAKFDL